VIAFEYAAPDRVEDALELLRRHGADAKVLAGGQSLVPILNYRLARPRLVVDINGLPLAGVGVRDGALRLGSLVRHRDLEESPEIAARCPVLREAAALIGNVRVRALGTLGGSLSHADPAAELPMVMTALGARFTVRSSRGTRTIGAKDFFTGYLSTALDPGELVTEVEVPASTGMGYAIEEASRRPGDFAIVAVTALVSLDARGRVDDVRLAFGGVAPTPVRALAAEDTLRGQEPATERITRAAAIASEALHPESDAFVSAAYRRLLARVLARRAMARAVARALSPAPVDRTATDASRAADLAGERLSGRPREAGLGDGAGSGASRADRPAARRLVINGRARDVDVLPHQTLLEVLRDTLGIFDVKEGCGEGVCGACTVLLDGRPVSSCLLLARSVGLRGITTVRGLERAGGLHPLQEAFVSHGAVQCGFCTPGILLTTLAYLDRHPEPDREAIRLALAGNLCRCTGYTKIVDAVEAYVRGAHRG